MYPGPTSKIFLPEFSRLYQAGDKKELASSFSMIMRIQMLFVGPLSVVLIGYPQVILNFLAKEMLTQTGLFIGCSFVFLFAATLGPCGGLMQMTDHEKADNVFREAANLPYAPRLCRYAPQSSVCTVRSVHPDLCRIFQQILSLYADGLDTFL